MRFALAVLLLWPLVLSAQTQPETDESHHEEERHRHFIGGFIGGTRLPHEHGVTVGAEYEYKLSERFGAGVTAESVGGNMNENVFVALGYFHPVESLSLFLGGGWDRRLKVEPESGSEEVGTFSDAEGELRGRRPLARVGLGYEIPLGRAVVAIPNLSLDFAGGETIAVFGVTVGFGF
jgi:hypothetical protein